MGILGIIGFFGVILLILYIFMRLQQLIYLPNRRLGYDCHRNKYGCCIDGYTPKYDRNGTNCPGYRK
jgi:hypothetical protein